MNFRIKIDERELKRQLKQEITRKVQSVLPKLQQTVSDRLEQVLFQRFVSGVPTISGQDFYELGVPDINDRLQSVIRVASQSFKVTFVGGTRNVFKMNIGILKKDYSDLLNLQILIQVANLTSVIQLVLVLIIVMLVVMLVVILGVMFCLVVGSHGFWRPHQTGIATAPPPFGRVLFHACGHLIDCPKPAWWNMSFLHVDLMP